MPVTGPKDILVLESDARESICKSLDRMATKLRRLYDFEDYLELDEACGCCGGYHPKGWAGDCRDDAHRLSSPEAGMTIFLNRFEIADGFRKLVQISTEDPKIRAKVESKLGPLGHYEQLAEDIS